MNEMIPQGADSVLLTEVDVAYKPEACCTVDNKASL